MSRPSLPRDNKSIPSFQKYHQNKDHINLQRMPSCKELTDSYSVPKFNDKKIFVLSFIFQLLYQFFIQSFMLFFQFITSYLIKKYKPKIHLNHTKNYINGLFDIETPWGPWIVNLLSSNKLFKYILSLFCNRLILFCLLILFSCCSCCRFLVI